MGKILNPDLLLGHRNGCNLSHIVLCITQMVKEGFFFFFLEAVALIAHSTATLIWNHVFVPMLNVSRATPTVMPLPFYSLFFIVCAHLNIFEIPHPVFGLQH